MRSPGNIKIDFATDDIGNDDSCCDEVVDVGTLGGAVLAMSAGVAAVADLDDLRVPLLQPRVWQVALFFRFNVAVET